MSNILNRDFILDVAAGKVNGYSIMKGLGEYESGNVDADGEDVCRWEDVGALPRLPTPSTSGEQMTLVSSNNNDKNGSNGVDTVRICYIDTHYEEQTEDIALNGTSTVDTVATDIIFINDMYSTIVGSNEVSRGNIVIYQKGGSATDTIYNFIVKGGNKSLVPHRMVPDGFKLVLKGWNCSEAQGKRAAFRIRSTDMKGELIEGVFCFKDTCYIKQSTSGELGLFDTIPARSIVKISHWDDQSASEGSASWWGVLMPE